MCAECLPPCGQKVYCLYTSIKKTLSIITMQDNIKEGIKESEKKTDLQLKNHLMLNEYILAKMDR